MKLVWRSGQFASLLATPSPLPGSMSCPPSADCSAVVHNSGSYSTRLLYESEGTALSPEAGRIDAVQAMRRDAEKLAELLGGTVRWEESP